MTEREKHRGVPVDLPGGGTLPWPVVCLDFDGVLAEYHGWEGAKTPGEPMPDARELIAALRDAGYSVVVHSARPALEIDDWLRRHGIAVDAVTPVKIPAQAYVDDRAVRYSPDMAVRDVMAAIGAGAHWES